MALARELVPILTRITSYLIHFEWANRSWLFLLPLFGAAVDGCKSDIGWCYPFRVVASLNDLFESKTLTTVARRVRLHPHRALTLAVDETLARKLIPVLVGFALLRLRAHAPIFGTCIIESLAEVCSLLDVNVSSPLRVEAGSDLLSGTAFSAGVLGLKYGAATASDLTLVGGQALASQPVEIVGLMVACLHIARAEVVLSCRWHRLGHNVLNRHCREDCVVDQLLGRNRAK
mmetsp:Transcript_5079/g.6198  ORF Transcript_5079/g.6198 Transcript_5079/m.6198 type:complete len:232 (-) Transcript_5079:35-730(-)